MNGDTGKQLRLTVLLDESLMRSIEAARNDFKSRHGFKISRSQLAAEALRRGLAAKPA